MVSGYEFLLRMHEYIHGECMPLRNYTKDASILIRKWYDN